MFTVQMACYINTKDGYFGTVPQKFTGINEFGYQLLPLRVLI